MKVSPWKTKLMISGRITMDGLSKSKAYPCTVCCLGVKANSVVYVQCGRWVHGRCAGVKRVTPKT